MARLCSSCRATSTLEARFCRYCGAPLKVSGERDEDEAPVSPLAQTVPLTDDGRTTEGLTATDGPGQTAPDTAKIGPAEMENILRRSRLEQSIAPESHEVENAFAAFESRATPSTAKIKNTAPPAAASSAATGPDSSHTRARRVWPILAFAILGLATVAGLLAFFSARRLASPGAGSMATSSINEQQKPFEVVLSEADALSAAGDVSGAIALLRNAVRLDPSNAKAHVELGNALAKGRAHREALEEYRAATQSDPNYARGWNALAAAQFEAGLYSDAVESYRRFIAVMNEADVGDQDWLRYADALRLAGRTDEARALYQRASLSKHENVAVPAKQRLAELSAPEQNTAADEEAAAHNTRPNSAPNRAAQASSNISSSASPAPPVARQSPPAPARTAQEHYRRGLALWSANRRAALEAFRAAAPSNPDAYYYLGLGYAEGREPKTLKQAELVAALQYFQLAQRGTHRAAASKYVERLGKEYDRRRSQR